MSEESNWSNVFLDSMTDGTSGPDVFTGRESTGARLRRYAGLFATLIRQSNEHAENPLESLPVITELAARVTSCERVSVWFFDDDFSTITCRDLYMISKKTHTSGLVLPSAQFPEYTASLKIGQVIAVYDVYSDRRTANIPASYFSEAGITSLLDAPVWANGALTALLSFEHTGSRRRWLPEEEQLALSLTLYISFLIESARYREALADLRRSEERLAVTLQSIGDGVIVTNPEGRIIRMNPTAERLTGWPFAEAAGKPLTEVFHIVNAHSGEKAGDPVSRVLKTGQIVGLANDTMLIARDGTRRQIADSAAPIRENDNISGVIIVFSDVTKEYAAREAMRRSETEKSLILNTTAELFVYCDPDLRIRWANRAYAAMSGRLPGDLVGRYCYDFCNRQAGACEGCPLVLARDTGRPQQGEVTFANGKVFYMRGYPVTDEKGTVTTLILFALDITVLKKVEMELLSEKKHLEALFCNSQNAIVKIDREHRVLDVNDSFVRLFGFSLAEIKGLDLDTVLDAGKQGTADRNLTETLMQGEYIKIEAVRYNRHGKRLHLSIRAIPIIVDGVVVGGYITFADITERKMAEEALRKSEERYREILASIEEGYYEADLAGRVTFCNDAACKILGYARKELVGKSYRHLFKEPKAVLKAFNRVYHTAKPNRSFTVEIKRKDGSTFFGELSVSPILNSEGAVTGFRGVARDISERIKVEEQLRYLSLHDQLTGLYNRTFFEEELKRLDGSRKYPITIISADLDGLKLINDTLGHDCGDRQLISCAKVMKESLRASDILARVGGDEFNAILPGTDEQTGEKIAGRIRENLEKYNQTHAGPPLSISLGVATALSKDTPLNELFKRADDLMYREKLYRCDSVRSQIVQALLAALAERDYITEGHAKRLAALCLKVGVKLNLSSRQLSDLALLAHVHDLGKVGIPDSILLKQGPLTEEEWEIMRLHPEKGYRIAMSSPDLSGVADLILKHHERWDGKGYPLGLKGKETPIECRILAIVDAYDAMTNGRPYSKAKHKKEALAELRRRAGSQFDPELVELFISVVE